MSKADKMFKELGYKKKETKFTTHYDKPDKRISIYNRVKKYGATNDIELNEHMAVHTKIKELGWL